MAGNLGIFESHFLGKWLAPDNFNTVFSISVTRVTQNSRQN